MDRKRLVVIGNGMTGLRFIEELLERAPNRFAITVIGAEPEPAYNRVLLSSLLARDIGLADVGLRSREWYAENGISLVSGCMAQKLDVENRNVSLDNGSALPFDTLVLATGSEPIRLKVPGANLPGVTTFRTLSDLDAFDVAAASGQSAAVIGGGLLGIEAAYGLVRRGVRVTLVHFVKDLMERQLDSEGARLLADALEARGVSLELAAETKAIVGTECVEGVELADGRVIPCGLVVMAVGIRPNSALAASGNLRVGRGVIVDECMMTSATDIYAIGECAEHRGICYGLVEPCYEQARVAASAIAGETAQYAGSVLATNLKVSGVPVFSVGDFVADGAETIFLRDAGVQAYRKLVLRDGRLAGAVLVGDTADALWYSDLVRSGASVTAFRAALAFGQAHAEAA